MMKIILTKNLFYFIIVIFFCVTLSFNINITTEQQYTYLAQSFLQGKLHFLDTMEVMEDTVYYKKQFYWHQGPFPAILLMPFVYVTSFFKIFFNQGYLQFFLTIGIFYLAFKIARLYKYTYKDALLLSFAFCFASVYQLIAFMPWVWYFVQAVTVFFLFLALYEFLTKKRYWLIGLYISFIFSSRFTAGLGVIFFILAIITNNKVWKIKTIQLTQLMLPVIISGGLLLLYNYLRFNNPWENGFLLSNNVLMNNAQRYELLNYGLFKLSNIPTNIYYYFIKSLDPVLVNLTSLWGNTYVLKFPYITVNYPGTSFFIVSPIFLYLFKSSLKEKRAKLALVAIITILIPLLCYYWPGWRQVGPRYLLDLLPFAYLLLMYVFPKRKLPSTAKILIIFSAFFNIYLFFHVFSK